MSPPPRKNTIYILFRTSNKTFYTVFTCNIYNIDINTHPSDTQSSFILQTNNYHSSFRHTIIIHPSDTQSSFILQTHNYHSSYRHTIIIHPSDTQLSFILQTHNYHSSFRHTIIIHPSDTQLSFILQTHNHHSSFRHIIIIHPSDSYMMQLELVFRLSMQNGCSRLSRLTIHGCNATLGIE